MNRRHFLTLLAGGAGIVAMEPVRRYWQVGALLTPEPRYIQMRSSLGPLSIDFAELRRHTGGEFKLSVAKQPTPPPGGWDEGSDVLAVPPGGHVEIVYQHVYADGAVKWDL